MKKIFIATILGACLALVACGGRDGTIDTSSIELACDAGSLEIKTIKNSEGEDTLYLPSFAADADVDEYEEDGIKCLFSKNIAAIFITTESGSLDAVNASADKSVSESGHITAVSGSGETLYDGALKKIKGRGNATWSCTKKPYNIELEKKTEFMGLSKAKKFALLANAYDPSLLRNRVALELASLTSDDYSPACVPADVYENGRYIGSYLVTDKIGISESRIDIEDLEKATEALSASPLDEYPRGGDTQSATAGSAKWYEIPEDTGDITGGYLLEVDYPERYPSEASGFVTKRGLPVVIKSPKYASKAQVEYISEYFGDFEDALFSEDGYNEKGGHISDYADLESLALRYLFEEFSLNIDGGIASFYVYKDASDGKLTFSCVWDYDCAFGNYNKYADLTDTSMFFVGASETRNNGTVPSLFHAFLSNAELNSLAHECYEEYFGEGVSKLLDMLPSLRDELAASANMDYDLYGSSERNFYEANAGENFEEAYGALYRFVHDRWIFFEDFY